MTDVANSIRTIAWLRGDLRLDDNPALAAAVRRGKGGCTAIFVMTPEQWKQHHWGEHRCGMMTGALTALRSGLDSKGIDLRVLRGSDDAAIAGVLLDVARTLDASEIHANREFGLNEERRDESVRDELLAPDIDFIRHEDQTILPVREIRSGGGTPYTVFTPFKNKWLALLQDTGIPELATVGTARRNPKLDPEQASSRRAGSISANRGRSRCSSRARKNPFEDSSVFSTVPILRYHEDRDTPSLDGTSTLSPVAGLRVDLSAPHSPSPRRRPRPDHRTLGRRARGLVERVDLARVLSTRHGRHSAALHGPTAPRLDESRPLAGRRRRIRGVVPRRDRDRHRGCRDETTRPDRLDAQSRPHDRRDLPVEAPPDRLETWRTVLHESTGRRRLPQQQRRLAVGRLDRNRRSALLPDLQSRSPGGAIRSRKTSTFERWVPEFDTAGAFPPIVDLKAARVRAIETFKTAKNG